MKKIISICVAIFLVANVFAQSPNKMSYQAVIRNSNNDLLVNTSVGMRISILQGSASGTEVFAETHNPTTNTNGLVSVEIGGGTPVTASFAVINWANGPYFVKTETDPTGGSNYSIIGTSQLLSVPYALHSKCVPVQVSSTGDTLTIGCHHIIIPGISAANPTSSSGTYPVGSVFCTGTPTAVVNVTNPVTGKTWMDRNLGASQVATSSFDDQAYGDLYQWGRGADGHQCRNSSTTSTLSSTNQPGNSSFILIQDSPYDWRSPQNTNLWQGVNGVNNPCPSGYRVPTETEWTAEYAAFSTQNAAGAFASPLKLPLSGFRYYSNGALFDVGTSGYYWSSTVSSTNSRHLYFNSSGADVYTYRRAYGFSVRCLKD